MLAAESLVVASHNPGKVREIRELLRPYATEILSAADLGLPEPEETGTSFTANARLKARAAAAGSGHAALADDSGLAVAALGGRPGIHSARWAGPECDFTAAMRRVEQELADQDDRRAAFVCVLCLARPDGSDRCFEGRVEGRLVWPPRGDKGFGYDPMFVLDGYDITFGEMDPAEKHRISHRALAFRKMVSYLGQRNSG
jgi:XTP/dITP diphosphohydrolase